MTESMRSLESKYHKYTDEQILWIESHHSDFTEYKPMLKAFEQEFGCCPSVRSIQHKCQELGLKFPFTGTRVKGRHGTKYIPIGSERIRKTGGTGRLMWFVKVNDELCIGDNRQGKGNWIPKHKLIWEQANGEVPKGYKITFLNNDSLDCRLDNLILVSDKTHLSMIRQGWYTENPILTETGIKVCEIEEVLERSK